MPIGDDSRATGLSLPARYGPLALPSIFAGYGRPSELQASLRVAGIFAGYGRLCGWRLSHSTREILRFVHRRFISSRNAINGTTTIVVPPYSANASNINNKLLPLLVGITATTRLSPATIALIASSYTPRNSALLPIIRLSYLLLSIFLSRCY